MGSSKNKPDAPPSFECTPECIKALAENKKIKGRARQFCILLLNDDNSVKLGHKMIEKVDIPKLVDANYIQKIDSSGKQKSCNSDSKSKSDKTSESKSKAESKGQSKDKSTDRSIIKVKSKKKLKKANKNKNSTIKTQSKINVKPQKKPAAEQTPNISPTLQLAAGDL